MRETICGQATLISCGMEMLGFVIFVAVLMLYALVYWRPRSFRCRLGIHKWRRTTFNDEFTEYRDQPGIICDRCCASQHLTEEDLRR